jgi:hypothetical protein
MYIVSDMVQEGAVWLLQPAYDILLQEGAGWYHVWICIVGNVVQEGAFWPLHPVYAIIQSDGLQELRAGHSIWI